MMYWMFLRMTYCTSVGVKDTTDTIDDAIFLVKFLISY